MEGCSADQAARRWLEDNEAMVADSAAPPGAVRNDAQDGTGRRQSEHVERRAHANKWAVLGLVVLGTFMMTLDASIVNISLPSIARTFHAPFGGAVEWVIIAYLVVIAATLLTFGRVSDIIGRKPVWVAGLVCFTLGSALCGAASSLAWLIAARIFQGLGGALLFAPGMAIITDAFPAAQHGLALGLTTVVAALGVSAGPTFGGLITEHMSWRWIFYLNVPLGVLDLLATFQSPNARALMNAAPRDEQGESSGLLATARVVGQSLSVALAGAIFASFGGATAARTLVAPAQHGMLVAGELSALQLTFLRSFRAALLACAIFAAIGIGTALVRGHERSPAARIKPDNAS